VIINLTSSVSRAIQNKSTVIKPYVARMYVIVVRLSAPNAQLQDKTLKRDDVKA